jgi:hypothetical protein
MLAEDRGLKKLELKQAVLLPACCCWLLLAADAACWVSGSLGTAVACSCLLQKSRPGAPACAFGGALMPMGPLRVDFPVFCSAYNASKGCVVLGGGGGPGNTGVKNKLVRPRTSACLSHTKPIAHPRRHRRLPCPSPTKQTPW